MHTSGVISISLISSIYFRVLSSVGTRHAVSVFSFFQYSEYSEYSENSEHSDCPGASNRFRFNPLRCLESAPARGCRDSACRVRLCFVIGHGMPCPYHASAFDFVDFAHARHNSNEFDSALAYTQNSLTRSFNLSVLTFPFISYPLRPAGSSP